MPWIFSGSGEYPLAENTPPMNVTESCLMDHLLPAVENETFIFGLCWTGLMMLASWSLVILPIDEHIVMYGQYSWALGYNVINSHLERYLGSSWVQTVHGVNLYLPRCVLNVVRSEAASIRCIPKKALLPSTLENLVAPVSTWAISSRVGALWFSQMMALLKSFGLRHTLNLPFAFLGYVRELTHGVGSVCLVMIPWCTSSPSFFFNLLLVLDGNFLSSVLYWKDCRVCLNVIISWHVTYAVKAVGEQHLKTPGTDQWM